MKFVMPIIEIIQSWLCQEFPNHSHKIIYGVNGEYIDINYGIYHLYILNDSQLSIIPQYVFSRHDVKIIESADPQSFDELKTVLWGLK